MRMKKHNNRNKKEGKSRSKRYNLEGNFCFLSPDSVLLFISSAYMLVISCISSSRPFHFKAGKYRFILSLVKVPVFEMSKTTR